jgi:2-phosphosulfolactate phosphatase
MLVPGHDQAGHRIRLEWGPTGGAAIARRADVAVVVDVLSFTTTVTVAVERGITVYPFRWRDERAAEYAEQLEANLALQRQDARYRAGAVSLSPGSLQTATGIEGWSCRRRTGPPSARSSRARARRSWRPACATRGP